MQSVESRTFKSTLYGLIQFALTFAQSILLVPLLLSRWGEEKYGIYLTVFAFIQVLRTIDLGHQSYIGNEFNKMYFIDKFKASSILASSVKMALLLGGAELLVFLVLWKSGIVYSLLGLAPDDSSWIIVGILCMVFMWWLVGSVAGVMARAVLSKGLYPQCILWAIVLKVMEIVFLIIAGVVNMSLFNLLWIWAIINLVYTAFTLNWLYRHLIEDKLKWPEGSWKQALIGLRNSVVLTLNNGFEQLNSNGIIFLITRFIALNAVPVYVTLRTLTNTAVQFAGLIVSPLQPDLIRYHSEKSGDKIYSVIQTAWIINGIIVNMALLAIVPFVSWIYTLWTNHMLEFNKQLFFLLCLSTALANFGRILITYLTGINDLKAITLMSCSRCLIVFSVSLMFIKDLGLISIGIGFLFAEIVSSVIIPVFLTKEKLRVINFKVNLYDILLAILPIGILAVCYIFDYYNLYSSLAISIIGIVAMSFIYFTQWHRLHIEVRLRLKTLTIQIITKGHKMTIRKQRLI